MSFQRHSKKKQASPKFVTSAVEGKNIYIGDVGVGKSENINQTLRYGEAKIEISEKNMYICFTNRESGNKIISELKAAITTDKAVNVSRSFSSSIALSSNAATLPEYLGGTQPTIGVGDNSTMLYVADTNIDEYESYIISLADDGFKPYGDCNTMEDN